MKTVLWKELREHARWVPVAVAVMAVVLVLQWRGDELVFDGASLAALVGLVACVVAAALGWAQAWGDRRPAARALLLHRGISAEAAFRGKLLAGISLYVIAVFVPLLCLAAFVAANGIERRAASPGALLPSAFLSLAAFCCWPAAMLTAQRDARFAGSRLAPALAACSTVIFCGALVDLMPRFAAATAAVMLVALVAAARGVFLDGSHVRSAGGRAGLAVVVSFSLFVVMTFMWTMVETQRIRSEQPTCTVELGPDGRPWLTQSRYSQVSYEYEPMRAARMVPGRSVQDELSPLKDGWKPLRQWTPYELGNYRPVLGRRFIELRRASTLRESSEVHRFWVFDAKGDAVLVYRLGLATTRTQYRLEKTLRPPDAAGSFGELRNVSGDDPFGGFTFVTTTGVFHAPDSGEGVRTVFALPPSAKYVGSAILNGSKSEPHRFGLMVRLDDRAILIEGKREPEGKREAAQRDMSNGLAQLSPAEARLPKSLTEAASISFARDPATDGLFFGLVHDFARTEKGVRWFHFDQEGHVLEEQQFEDDSQVPNSPPILAAAAIPPGLWAVGTLVAIVESRKGMGLQQLWLEVKKKPAEAVRALSLGSIQPLLGIVLAIWAARRRRLAKRQTYWWVLWAFFFGPYGGLALLAVYPRILRQPCANCRQATRVDLESCERCGHSLDDVPTTGIELFDRGLPVGAEVVSPPAT